MVAKGHLRGVAMFLGIAFAPACNLLDDDAAADATAPATEPAPSAAEPAPEDPTAQPGVVLTDAGKEPHAPVAALPAAGAKKPLVLSLRVTHGKRKKLRFPLVRFDVESTLEAVSAPAKTRRIVLRDVRLPGAGVDDAELTAKQGAFRTALAKLTNVETDSLEVATTSVDGDPEMALMLSAAQHAFAHLTVAFPTEAIGRGAAWDVRRDLTLFGLPVRQTLHCTLKELDGPQIEVSGEVEYALAPGTTDAGSAALGLVSVSSVTGTAKLSARIDLPSATPVEARIRGKLSVEGTDAQGRSRTPRVGIDLRVDEAYLAGQDARVKLDGEFAQGGLVHGVVPPESRVWFNKKRVKVSNEGDFLIGFGRHAASRAILSFELPDGPTERHIVQVRDRVFEPEEIDGLPEEMVKLDRETKRELAKSRRRIGKVRGRSTKVPYFRDGWQWPAKGKITSTYGRKRKLNGVEKGFHWGVDIAAPVGRTVVAPAPGKVVFVEEDVPLSGLLLILDHGHGLTSSFLHLSAFSVNVGDVVEAGQEIGKVGNTGRSTGPHLDWRMNLFDARIDPQLLVEHLGPPQ